MSDLNQDPNTGYLSVLRLAVTIVFSSLHTGIS